MPYKDPLKNKECIAKYRLEHKEEIDTQNKEYREKHKEVIREKLKQYSQTKKGAAVFRINKYRGMDRKKGFSIDGMITPEWIEANIFSGQTCIYCGESDWHKLGTDRIDNSKGHTPDNCVPCCASCNNKRNAKPFLEFLSKSETPTAKVLYSMHMIENAGRLALASLLDD